VIFCPNTADSTASGDFFLVLADYLRTMRGSGETVILTLFGNDDFHALEPLAKCSI